MMTSRSRSRWTCTSSLANHTGTWRSERPGLRRRAAAVQPRLPGRRAGAGLALRGRGRQLRAGLAPAGQRQPVPGRHGPGLLPPVRDGLQPRPARHGGRHQLGRAVPRRRGDRAGLAAARSRAARPAAGCWSSAPARAGCRRPTTCAALGHEVEIREAGGAARRHDALRHPDLPAAARRARRRDRPRCSRLGITLRLNTRVDDLVEAMREAGSSTPRCWRSAPSSAIARTSRPARRRASSTRCACSATPRRASGPQLGRTRRRLRRRQHRDGRRPHRPPARRRRRPHRLPAHPGADAGQRDVELQEALDEGVQIKWLRDDHPGRRRHDDAGEDAAGRGRRAAADRRVRGPDRRLASCSRSARTSTGRSAHSAPQITVADGVVEVDADR